jgi:hypothetical protein
MSTARYVLQMQGDLGESRLLARALFLTSIIRLRPDVVKDLWQTVLPAFRLAVLAHFHSEIFQGIDPEEYQKEKEKEFIEAPQLCGDYLVDLIQRKLSLRHTTLAIGDNPLRHAFFSFYRITQAEDCKHLVDEIQEWSQRWNLRAEWCRDHALAVLRAWLGHNEIRWAGVFPSRLWPVQFDGWRSAVSELEDNALFSQVLVELKTEAKPKAPKRLVFKPGKKDPAFCFEIWWNVAEESEAQFKKRVRIDFKLWLLETEATRIRILKKDEESKPLSVKEFEKQLAPRNLAGPDGVNQFGRELRKYITKVKDWKKKTKAKHRLVEASGEPHIEHVRWLVLYQVPGPCLTYSEIVKVAGKLTLLTLPGSLLCHPYLSRSVSSAFEFLFPPITRDPTYSTDSVRKSIQKAAELIDLSLRDPHQHAGRPRGTGKPILHKVTPQKTRN